MFDRLKRRLRTKTEVPPEGVSSEPLASLNDAYRLHREEDVERFTLLAAEAFPQFASRIRCFGADWLGRQFATDKGRIVAGDEQILLLEPGSGEVYQIPESFDSFHGQEILEHPNEVVEFGLFKEWLAAGGARPSYNECIATRIPLFLGGAHDLSNFELSDLEVHWSICGQLLAQVRDLPAGTAINRITIG